MQTSSKLYLRFKVWLLPAYLRILHWCWQARNLLTGNRPISFYAGQRRFKLYPQGSIPEFLYSGNFEAAERDFVAEFLQPGMIVVDAGANVGLYSLISSALVGLSGQVHAFEPKKLSFDRLKMNLELNQSKNVTVNRIALSNNNKQMVLRMDSTHPTLDSHCFVRPMQEVTCQFSTDEIVKSQTLDEYFLTSGRAIDFMKIDVEGAELSLLQGAKEVLAHSPNITILLECTQNRQQVRDLLLGCGFKCFIWDCLKGGVLRPVVYDEVIATSSIILRRQPWAKE